MAGAGEEVVLMAVFVGRGDELKTIVSSSFPLSFLATYYIAILP